MPDLSATAVSAWIRVHEPRLAADMASSIPFGGEHETVLPTLLRLGETLDAVDLHHPKRFDVLLEQNEILGKFQAMLPELGVGRRLYLLNWLSVRESRPDIAAALLGSGESEAARFLRAEFQSLHRRALLTRIFSPARIKSLLDATERSHDV